MNYSINTIVWAVAMALALLSGACGYILAKYREKAFSGHKFEFGISDDEYRRMSDADRMAWHSYGFLSRYVSFCTRAFWCLVFFCFMYLFGNMVSVVLAVAIPVILLYVFIKYHRQWQR